MHPHMLRHATGYKLANDGQDTRAIQHYLGHRNIQHTTRYTGRIGSRTSGEIDAPGRARRKFRRLGLTPPDQLGFLKDSGSDQAQGSLFSIPVCAADVPRLFTARQSADAIPA